MHGPRNKANFDTLSVLWTCSSEYKQKYDEIVKQNGILNIDSRVRCNLVFVSLILSCLFCHSVCAMWTPTQFDVSNLAQYTIVGNGNWHQRADERHGNPPPR